MNITSYPRVISAAAAVCTFATFAGAQTLINFSSATDLNSFTEKGQTAGTQFSVNTSLSGVGGSNGVLLATENVDETLIYNPASNATTTWAATPSQTVSVFFQYRGIRADVTLVYAQIGLLQNTSQSFNNSNSYASVRVRYVNGTGFQLEGQSANGGTAFNYETTTLPNFTTGLVLNNWYKLSVTFSKSGTSNTLNYSASLDNFGANGGSLVGNVQSISGTHTVTTTMYNSATALYSGIRSTVGTGQGYLDDFTAAAIPEPSAFAALAGIGALGLAASRRRSRRE